MSSWHKDIYSPVSQFRGTGVCIAWVRRGRSGLRLLRMGPFQDSAIEIHIEDF